MGIIATIKDKLGLNGKNSMRYVTEDGRTITYMEKFKRGQRVGRRQPCPCGSRKKYKDCCFALDRDKAEKGWLR